MEYKEALEVKLVIEQSTEKKLQALLVDLCMVLARAAPQTASEMDRGVMDRISIGDSNYAKCLRKLPAPLQELQTG